MARADEKSDAAVHAIYNERLHELMQSLSRASLARVPQEIGTNAERRQRSRAVAYVAAEMVDAAERIPDVLTDVDLTPDQRAKFIALANRLQIQATDLETLARDNRVLEMESKFYEINQTCAACHQAFRVLPLVTSQPSN